MTAAARIHLSIADVTELEVAAVAEAMRSGWVTGAGPSIDAFERAIAERLGVAGAVALSTGTAALHLALQHVGVRPGVVVVCPTLTFMATAAPIVQLGATPVFVDCLPDGNVDPAVLIATVDDLRASGQEVAAVLSVDLFGRCCNYDEFAQAIADRGIPLIEDAAEALGASTGGRPAGTFGRAAILSFNGNKVMTTSGGGMLVSDDLALLAHARKLATQAREPVPWYEHLEVGYNYRMSNILAALGLAQLSRLEQMIARRRRVRDFYRAAFADLPVHFLHDGGDEPTGLYDNCWLTTVVLDEGAGVRVGDVIASLDQVGIEARHVWKPLHLQPAFDGVVYRGPHRHAEEIFARGVNLPSGSVLSDADLERVATAVRGVWA